MFQDQANQGYRKIKDRMCRKMNGWGRWGNFNKARKACEDTKECTGVVNFKCSDKRYRLCKSFEFRPTNKGHCVFPKNQGNAR